MALRPPALTDIAGACRRDFPGQLLNAGRRDPGDLRRPLGGFLNAVFAGAGNDSNLLIVFYVQIMPDDFVMQLHRF